MINKSIAWIKNSNSECYEKTKMFRDISDSKERYICFIRTNKSDSHWNNYENHIIWADNLTEAISFFSVEFPDQAIEIDLKGNIIWTSKESEVVANGGQYSLF